MREPDNCLSCKRSLSAYLDHELPPSLMAAVAAHLSSCASCRNEHDSLRSAMDSLATLQAPEAPCRLDATIMNRISQEKRVSFWFGLVPASVCAIAIGLFVGVLLANGTIYKTTDSMMASNDGIMRAMDVFSPAPHGSVSGVYFAMSDTTQHNSEDEPNR